MEKQTPLKILYGKYLNDTITYAERKELYDLFLKSSQLELEELVHNYFKQDNIPTDLGHLQADTDRIFDAIQSKTTGTKVIPLQKTSRWLRYSGIAAIVIATVLSGIYLIERNFSDKTEILSDVEPGRSSATLTLADGRKIKLSTALHGMIAREAGGVNISKTADGRLIYTVAENGSSGGSLATQGLNTLSTARGETFQVVLPDGSNVWLNAGSSIQYPNSFSSMKERKIELRGEAYFEVAHNKAKPFIVKTREQDVTVTGTQFNINSYADDGRIITTLTEGSVRVNTSGRKQGLMLTPGNQVVNTAGNLIVRPADLTTALAWKQGLIYFRNASLQQVLREIGRWYNVEVSYDGEPGKEVFSGGIKRNASLSEVLRVLELSNIHFIIKKEKGITTLTATQKK